MDGIPVQLGDQDLHGARRGGPYRRLRGSVVRLGQVGLILRHLEQHLVLVAHLGDKLIFA